MLTNRIGMALVAISALLGAAAPATPAWAGLLTYDFTVRGGSGPLASAVVTGSFSFDEALIPPSGNGVVEGRGLLSHLSFVWNGIAYDETTANTGDLAFSSFPPGGLSGFSIGNDCSGSGPVPPSSCLVNAHTNDWRAAHFFIYALPDSDITFGGTEVTFAQRVVVTPESPTLVLLGFSFTLLARVGWRRRRNSWPLFRVARYVEWRGQGQELNDAKWARRLVPVIGTAK